METPVVKRFFWQVMTLFTTMLLFGIVALLLTGCNKFEIAKRKYATTVVDTTYTTITTVVPKDSVMLTVRTDTTRVLIREKQGRATIIYQRDPKVTTIRAECDTVVVEKKVPVYVQKQVWGVDPRYKQKADSRLVVIWILLGFLVAVVGAYFLARRYLFNVTVTKRTDETLPG